MTFGNRIKELRHEKKWTQEYVAEQLNISCGALSRYESSMYEPKSLAIISAFADLYEVSTDFLLGKSKYRNIKEFQNTLTIKEKFQNMLFYMDEKDISELYMIPLYNKLEVNAPYLKKDNIVGYIPSNPLLFHAQNPEDYFYIVIQEEGMNLKINKGDYVLIEKSENIQNGDIVLVLLEKQQYVLRKFKTIDKQRVLLEPVSDNINLDSILCDTSKKNLILLGKAIGYMGKL